MDINSKKRELLKKLGIVGGASFLAPTVFSDTRITDTSIYTEVLGLKDNILNRNYVIDIEDGDPVLKDPEGNVYDIVDIPFASAVVYKKDNKVIAKSWTGSKWKIIAQGEAGVDDAEVIQSAIDSLTPNRTWKERVVLIGDFVIYQTILIHSYTVIEGGFLKLADNANCNIFENSDKTNENTNIELRDIQIYGNRDKQTDIASEIYFENVSDLKIKNCRIEETRGDGIHCKNCNNVKIIDNELINNREATHANGIRLETCSDVLVRGNYIENPAFHCIGFSQEIYDATVEENILKNASWHGIITFAQNNAELRCKNITIANNKVYGVGKTGIYLDQYVENASVIGNTVRDTGEHGIFCDIGCQKATIVGNTIYNAGLVGIYAGVGLAEEIVVSNNIVDTTGSHGIRVNASEYGNVKNIIVSNNIIKNVPTSGEKKGIIISDDGTYRYENAIVTGNIIDTAQYGIVLYTSNTENPPSWVDVFGNIVRNWVTDDISIHGSIKRLRKKGTATFSGDGSTTQFKIKHGLVSTPSKVLVTPMTSDAAGDFYVTADDTYIYVNYKTAPPSGSNNIKLSWYAEV